MSCKIFLKDLYGNITGVDLCVDSEEELKNMTVEEFKRRAFPEDKDDMWRLIYEYKQLENHHTLGDYNISNGCTIHTVKRLRGGEPPPDEDKGVPRTESMEKLADMQQEESSGSCCII